MTRVEWLTKKHAEASIIVEQLEAERLHNRSAEHKALLQLLKKEKLRYKSELNSLLHDNETV
jgi:CRISPR/Cas system-associated protein Csm6